MSTTTQRVFNFSAGPAALPVPVDDDVRQATFDLGVGRLTRLCDLRHRFARLRIVPTLFLSVRGLGGIGLRQLLARARGSPTDAPAPRVVVNDAVPGEAHLGFPVRIGDDLRGDPGVREGGGRFLALLAKVRDVRILCRDELVVRAQGQTHAPALCVVRDDALLAEDDLRRVVLPNDDLGCLGCGGGRKGQQREKGRGDSRDLVSYHRTNLLLAEPRLALDVAVDDSPETLRLDLSGEGGDLLVRRQGEGLDALQHIANTIFRRQLQDRRLVIDCLDFRRGKDAELKQMTRFLMERAKSTGTPQEIGPLNSYARRIVHITVSEDPLVSSESIGDAAMKTVIISTRG